jgi:tyrosyl-DNA phosphodiesterase-1
MGEPPLKRPIDANASPHLPQPKRAAAAAALIDCPPIHLFKVKAGTSESEKLPDYYNEGFLGASLSELVKGDIEYALIATKNVDWDWLLSACPVLENVQSIMLVHGEAKSRRKPLSDAIKKHSNVKEHIPPLPAKFQIHHTKLFILRYRKRGLRVIIHSANLMYYQCNNKTQGLFYQDFPLKSNQSCPDTTPFQEALVEYVKALWLGNEMDKEELLDVVSMHDFSAARVHLIPSVPSGTEENDERGFTEEESQSFGSRKLEACLRLETFDDKFSGAPIICQSTSIGGTLTDDWLDSFATSLSAGNAANIGTLLGRPTEGSDGIHIVWPTSEEVRNSFEGWFAGRSLLGSSGNVLRGYLLPKYRHFSGGVVGRQRAMPHIKSYTRFDPGSKEMAWFYVGSHNCNPHAWGVVQETTKAGNPQGESSRETTTTLSSFKIMSFELGVLLVPSLEKAYRCSKWYGFSCTDPLQPVGPMPGVEKVKFVQWRLGMPQAANLDRGVLTVPLPVPYDLPPTAYQTGDVPFIADKPNSPGDDAHGLVYPGLKESKVCYGVKEDVSWEQFIAKGKS